VRVAQVQGRLAELEIDVLIAGPSADYRWLTGLEPPIATRLTLAIVPATGDPVIVTPLFEAPAAASFAVATWVDGEDPTLLAAEALVRSRPMTVAVSDRTWSRYLVALQDVLPEVRFVSASEVLEPLRARKDPDELAALRRAGAAVDATLARLPDLRWEGRRERDVAREIADLMLACGHDAIHDVIVASGPQGALPHAVPGDRVILAGDAIVVDIGGEVDGYASDVTRMVVVGDAGGHYRHVHDAVERAHDAGRDAARVGTETGAVDAAARAVLVSAGLGDAFTHRLGHGIGLDTHEAPYLAPGATTLLAEGMAFSIEPGAYLPGRFGVRIEDIYLMGADGPEPVTRTPHGPITVA
jgi:D-alanyl-D-alanine dipeptidase